jgi:hypothetical protein
VPIRPPPSPSRGTVTLLLALTAPPLGLVAWILLSGGERPHYFQSGLIRAGAATIVVGALPLLFVGVAAAVGLWPDPNPNPIGLGLLLVAAGGAGSLLALVGIIRCAARLRDGTEVGAPSRQ